MEIAIIEAIAELVHRALAQLHDLQLADHISRRLPRVDGIALDRLADVAVRIGGVGLQIVDRLFAAPALVMQAGVHHQPRRAPQLHAQPAEVGIRIGVEAHILAQRLGIQPPAFAIGGDAAELAEGRDALQLGLHRQLQMMAGQPFMIEQRFQLVLRHVLQIVEIHIVDTGPRAVRRGPAVKGLACALFTERLDRLHLQISLGQRVEEAGQRRRHRIALCLHIGQIGLARVVIIFRVGAHFLEEILQAARKTHLLHDAAHFAMDTRHILQPQIMDLVRAEIRRGVVFQQRGIIIGAFVEPPDAILGRRDLLLAKHFLAQGKIGRAALTGPCGAGGADQFRLARIGKVQRVHLLRDILEDRIVLPQHIVDIRQDIGIDPVRRHHALLRPIARFRRQLRHHLAQPVDARDIGLRLAFIADAVNVDEEGGQPGLRAVHLIEHIAIFAIGIE